MHEKLTFGEYLSAKRVRAGMSKKEMASCISLSATYYSNIENGVRPAPATDVQKSIAAALGLSKQEAACLFDLATKTKKHKNLPVDICEYVESDADVKAFLRKAYSRGVSGNELLKLL